MNDETRPKSRIKVACGRCRAEFEVEAGDDRFTCPRCACLHVGDAVSLGVAS